MKVLVSACTLAAAVVLSGCATGGMGVDFNSKAVASLVPGKTTREEVIKRVGPLGKTQIFTTKKDVADKDLPGPVVIEYSRYYFNDIASVGADSRLRATRHLTVAFTNSTLNYYRLSSNFVEDSTNFDEDKVSKISKGMAEADVIALMGKPSGRAIYPHTREPGGTSMSYHMASPHPTSHQVHIKTLVINFDLNHKVSDVDLKVKVEGGRDE